MGYKIIAFQIDPIQALNFKTDSSLLIANEFQNRGYTLFFYSPSEMVLKAEKLFAYGKYVSLDYSQRDITLIKEAVLDLNDAQLILIRNDPPFNMDYITATYMLEKIKENVLILNDPVSIRDCPEKISIFDFSKFIPPTIITSDYCEIEKFIKQHGICVVKPLYECGGKDVKILKMLNVELVKNYLKKYKYVLLQKYLENIKSFGDKRVILVDGKIESAIQRIPQPNDFRANVVIGGKACSTTLTDREKEVCIVVGEKLKEKNIFLAGIDLIDSFLIEINITSPTGLVSVNNIYGVQIEKNIVTQLEEKLKINIKDDKRH